MNFTKSNYILLVIDVYFYLILYTVNVIWVSMCLYVVCGGSRGVTNGCK